MKPFTTVEETVRWFKANWPQGIFSVVEQSCSNGPVEHVTIGPLALLMLRSRAEGDRMNCQPSAGDK